MDPVTHLMTGAVLARAGFNRKAAYATVAMTLAAEAPDLDVLWSLGGPVAAFQHYRGWTHTFLGLQFEAALVVAVIYLFHQWRERRATTLPASRSQPLTKPPVAPVRWGLLWLFSLIALASHLLLDYTNNYGLRPLAPFDPHWHSASIVFIIEPVILLLLLLALVAPSLFSLINSEVGARRYPFRGRGWAIFALTAIVALWSFRWYQHARAEQLAYAEDYGAEVLNVDANPLPINPFEWHVVVETPLFYQLVTVNTFTGAIATSQQADVFYKPPTTLATLAAKRSWLGEVYLDWARIPLVTETATPLQDDVFVPGSTALVTFRDLRFFYDTAFLSGRSHPPLSGSVTVDQDRKVVRMEMNGSVQR